MEEYLFLYTFGTGIMEFSPWQKKLSEKTKTKIKNRTPQRIMVKLLSLLYILTIDITFHDALSLTLLNLWELEKEEVLT